MIKIGNIQINQKMHRILVGMHASPCVRSASESEPLSEILGLQGQHVMPVVQGDHGVVAKIGELPSGKLT